MFGNDIIAAHVETEQADLFITLIDAFILDSTKTQGLPWVAYLPIDHYPISRPVDKSLRAGNGIPIAMSKFGRNTLREAGYDPLYVPHAVDPDYLTIQDKAECKKSFEWQDKFIVGMVAANKGIPSRKSFPEVFEAFEAFHRAYPESILYLHTEQNTPIGYDLKVMGQAYGIPNDSLMFANHYKYMVGVGTELMRDLYNSFDVLANPSTGEGFGIPIIEAQACGTPVIVTNWTSMPELCWFGKMVNGTKIYTAQEAFQMLPNVNEIYNSLIWAYNLPKEEREKGAERARTMAWEYHPDKIVREYWGPALLEAHKRILDRNKSREKEIIIRETTDDSKNNNSVLDSGGPTTHRSRNS